MKQYRKNNDEIEVVETIEQIRYLDIEMIQRDIEMLDAQIEDFKTKRRELQEDLKEIKKLE